MLPWYVIFQHPHEKNGLQAPVVKDMIDARLASVWLKLITSNNLWAKMGRKIIESNIQRKRNMTVMEALTPDGSTFSVAKATEFLRQLSITSTMAQQNQRTESEASEY
ncbi:9581_t:CDS:2, partial [Scutellospora calospora]